MIRHFGDAQDPQHRQHTLAAMCTVVYREAVRPSWSSFGPLGPPIGYNCADLSPRVSLGWRLQSLFQLQKTWPQFFLELSLNVFGCICLLDLQQNQTNGN